MTVFKCKMCGGTIEFEQGSTIGICDSCGTKQTLPHLNDERRSNLYDRANHFRRNNEFDKAAGIYEQILNEDTTDAEAYWSLVLCRFGIEYVEDPSTQKRVPTVNRAQYTSIFDDDNYKMALQYADDSQRVLYEEEAATINELQKDILAISRKEKPFDIFICYKETDANGKRTPDSVLANDLYHLLVQEGFKVFFSRITLEDKLGTAYEPYIFAALNSAMVMVVLGTKPEYFNAAWVKNEWSRYLQIVKQSGGKKVLIPAYRDIDPYDLPEEFSHLQAQDMSKLGFMQDLIRGIKKIIKTDESKSAEKESAAVSTDHSNAAPLLRRAFMFLEDGDWAKADDFCEQVLNLEPENPQAYVGKLMSELQVHRQADLSKCKTPFDHKKNYQKAMRFGDTKLQMELAGYNTLINERNEKERLTNIYNKAISIMDSSKNEESFKAAAALFKSIPGFENADDLLIECNKKADTYRKEEVYKQAEARMNERTIAGYESAIRIWETIPGWKDTDERMRTCREGIEELKEGFYSDAKSLMDKGTIADFEKAIAVFQKIPDWKDSKEQILSCQDKIDLIKVQEEAEQREREKAERLEAERTAKKRKKGIIIVVAAVLACIIFVLLLILVIMPNSKLQSQYKAAIATRDEGNLIDAFNSFRILDGYKDSAKQAEATYTQYIDSVYNGVIAQRDAKGMMEAYKNLQSLNGYKDSAQKAEEIYEQYTDIRYDEAVSLLAEGKVVEAYKEFRNLEGYKDSSEKANNLFGQYISTAMNNVNVGDHIFFGLYEQDNEEFNGKEFIEWQVLAKEGNYILVLSEYGLDCQPYNVAHVDVTWETCSLRTWLNNTFVNTAFTPVEQEMLFSTTVKAYENPTFDTSPGNDTVDKVFLLSIQEAENYLGLIESTASNVNQTGDHPYETTLFAKAHGAQWDNDGEIVNCSWWLRSPGYQASYAATVSYDGKITGGGGKVNSTSVVRPALWIDCSRY